MRLGLSRRSFLKGVCYGTCGSAIHGLFSNSPGMMAYALPTMKAAIPGRVLVIVDLAGGCSYNITPIYHGVYRDKNPTISYGPEDSFPIAGDQGLHPALTYLHTLFQEGSLGIVNMCGIDEQSRSHDEAERQWKQATSMPSGSRAGWAALLTQQTGEFFSGISLAGFNDLIRGGTNPPRALNDLENFGEDRFKYSDERSEWYRMTREAIMAQSSRNASDNYAFVKESMLNIERSSAIIRQETSQPLPAIADPFPNSGFGNMCLDAARIIAAPSLGTDLLYLRHGGFDTHSDERDRLSELLSELNDGLRSLIQTIKALGRWNDVVIVTMSEFCRTFENLSLGTDHGAGGPVAVMGGLINGRQMTAAPSPAEIAAADSFLSGYHVSFQSVYAEIIQNFLGLDAAAIFTDPYPATALGIFR